MTVTVETKGNAAVAWARGRTHRFYEDRYRVLVKSIPLVAGQDRGEVFAVFDGIGSAPQGMQAAQTMADALIDFYRTADYPATTKGLCALLLQANETIKGWGSVEGSNLPRGGCAGTVAWIHDETLHLFHAGDTSAVVIPAQCAPRQLTREHHTASGAISRYFGLGTALEIETTALAIEDGDRLLLMTDGVTQVIDYLNAAKLVRDIDALDRAAGALAERSIARGSNDDVTVLLLEYANE